MEAAELPEHEPMGWHGRLQGLEKAVAFFSAVCSSLDQGTGRRVKVGCGVSVVCVGAVWDG